VLYLDYSELMAVATDYTDIGVTAVQFQFTPLQTLMILTLVSHMTAGYYWRVAGELPTDPEQDVIDSMVADALERLMNGTPIF